MALSLAELLSPKTSDEIFDDLVAALTAEGFAPSAFQPGGVARALIRIDATVLAVLWGLVAQIARGSMLDLATGPWLTLHVKSRFDLDRIAATFARHSITLVNAAGSPTTITAGQLLMTGASGAVRYRSTNTTSVNVPGSGGTAAITVQAETAGTAGNAAPTVLMVPAVAGLSFTYGSVTSRARNEESDPELRTRARARWSQRSAGATRAYYEFWILSALMPDGTSAAATRAKFEAPPGDGTFVVVVSASDGPLSTDQLTAVASTVAAHEAYTDRPSVVNATARVVAIAATVKVRPGFNTAPNRALALAALAAYKSSIGIGDANGVDVHAIGHALYAAAGVVNVDIATPAADVVLGSREVVQFDTSGLAWSEAT